ncbi:MAG: diguanylate cyclase [Streptosporangiales bacterium]|nr:diguanylate cyclase [Streptosporangiales bacterium]
MSVLHGAGTGGGSSLIRSVRRWPLWAQPGRLVVYILAVVTLAAIVGVVGLARLPLRLEDVATFGALMGCGAVCIETVRRHGMPAGMSKDMLSAWWIPVALLLPSPYALLAPAILYTLIQLRVRRTVLYRRVFSAAAIGLAGAVASIVFHLVVPEPLRGSPAAWVMEARAAIPAAVACGALFTVVNSTLVAVAAHMAVPETSWRELLWESENLALDVVELCTGILVTVAAALTPALLLLTLPPVALLQRSLLHAQLQAAARTDAKTGLLNAAAWQREADTEISRTARTDEPLAMLIADIDHFKVINDTHGHLVGDQVLAWVADTLRAQLRDSDLVGRFGGEEFVVLLPGADALEACRVAERLRIRVGRMAVPVEDDLIGVTISVGVAVLRTDGDDLIELLAAADLALYRAKDQGRNRVGVSPTIEVSDDEGAGKDD